MGQLRKLIRRLDGVYAYPQHAVELEHAKADNEQMFHYWYSAEQDAYLEAKSPHYHHKYVLINGIKHKFTQMSAVPEHGSAWADIKYLGTSYARFVTYVI